MKVAALDLGSNSFLCLIADVSSGKLIEIEDHCEIVKLGKGVQATGAFAQESLDRAHSCLRKFKERIDHNKIEQVKAVATSAARDASNGEVLIKICDDLNIPVEIITGSREAELTYKGVQTAHPEKNFLVVDVGGGSTEFAYYENETLYKKSINVGCVRLTEKFLSTEQSSEKQINQFNEFVINELNQVKFNKNIPEIIAVAGTPTTLAGVKLKIPFDAKRIEDSILTKQDLDDFIQLFSKMTLDSRKNIPGMVRERADVILAGTLILKNVLTAVKKNQFKVSTRGIRYGLAMELGE